jgi:hypothetical protein
MQHLFQISITKTYRDQEKFKILEISTIEDSRSELVRWRMKWNRIREELHI